MKRIVSILGIIICFLADGNAQFYDFYADTDNGDRLFYRIVSDGVEVVSERTGPPNYLSGGWHIEIPNTVSNAGISYPVVGIAGFAFLGASIGSVTIHAPIRYIESSAFKDCSNLQTVRLDDPSNLTTIGDRAFNNCSNLSLVEIGENLQYIGSYAFNNTDIHSFYIPEGVTYIGRGAFRGSPLSTLYYYAVNCTFAGDPAISSDYSAFGSTLYKVYIGPDVQSLPNSLFYGCSWLDTIVCHAFTPPSVNNSVTFYQVSKTWTVVRVPCGSRELYRTANGWQEFNDIRDDCPLSVVATSDDYDRGYTMTTDESGHTLIPPYTTMRSYVWIYPIPMPGYVFSHWSDGSHDNPKFIEVTSDTAIVAYFVPISDYCSNDTVYVHDTTYIDVPYAVHDTTYIDVPYAVHDTIYIDVPYAVHDTTYIDVPYAVHDTTYIDVPYAVHDTTYIDVPYAVHDTTYIDVPYAVHDTIYIDVPYAVHDTTYIDVPYAVHDTTYIDVPYAVHDTTYITLTDTVTVTLVDTLTVYQTDTLYIDRIVHDTVYIYDTVYVGVDDVQTVNYMLYQQGGQIVVEGAEGSPVTVYDAVGRLLATRRDTYGPVRFDAPAAGTYLVRVGSAAARRIVVVR